MRRIYMPYVEDHMPEKDNGSLKDGLSSQKPLRKPWEGHPCRESSTEYFDKLEKESE